jgi:hypothetical protein
MPKLTANHVFESGRAMMLRAIQHERYALNCRGHREFGSIYKLMESHYGCFA